MPEGATKNIAWVGKGIVYDTGGLSIKDKVSRVGCLLRFLHLVSQAQFRCGSVVPCQQFWLTTGLTLGMTIDSGKRHEGLGPLDKSSLGKFWHCSGTIPESS